MFADIELIPEDSVLKNGYRKVEFKGQHDVISAKVIGKIYDFYQICLIGL